MSLKSPISVVPEGHETIPSLSAVMFVFSPWENERNPQKNKTKDINKLYFLFVKYNWCLLKKLTKSSIIYLCDLYGLIVLTYKFLYLPP